MEATRSRVLPVVVPAAGVAALIAWILREHAEFLPSDSLIRRSMPAMAAAGSGHHGGGGFVAPAPVARDALANFAGLTAVALHVLLIAVAVTGYCLRRWSRNSTVDSQSVLMRLVFAGTVALAAALVTAGMAAVLLGTAISSAGTMAAAITAFQYSFVLVVVFAAALGVP